MALMFINGQSVAALSGKTLEVRSPVDGRVFDSLPRGEAADIDLAVRAARAALDADWGRLTATERGRLLHKLGEAVLAHHEELAQLEALQLAGFCAWQGAQKDHLARVFEGRYRGLHVFLQSADHSNKLRRGRFTSGCQTFKNISTPSDIFMPSHSEN